jgi:hypothetical protein
VEGSLWIDREARRWEVARGSGESMRGRAWLGCTREGVRGCAGRAGWLGWLVGPFGRGDGPLVHHPR